jgi:multidrug resistance efflux pump
MSTASEPIVSRPRAAPPRLSLLPVPPSPKRSPWRRSAWLIGLAVIVIGGLGAAKMLTLGSGESARDKNSNGAVVPANGSYQVVCHGTVDVDGGIRNLAPTQPGEVSEIYVTEGQHVKDGDPILKVNDEPAKIAVAGHEAALENAAAQLAQAQLGIKTLLLGLEEQQSAIDAAQAKLSAAESDLKRLEALKEKDLTNENALNSARSLVTGLKAALSAEQTKYRRIQLMKPEEKIKEAESGVRVAEEKLRAEKFKLEQCTLRAPCDGTILRINVSKGTLITPQLRQAPVMLLPAGIRIVRAEVLSEFSGRVKPGMEATIDDEANKGATWHGKVIRLADAFLPPRPNGNEGLSLNGGAPTLLECVVELTPSDAPPRIGQRVRVAIGSK